MSVYKGIYDLDVDISDEEYARNMLDGTWVLFSWRKKVLTSFGVRFGFFRVA